MSKPSVVAREERDEDGFWIYLKDGWQDGSNPGSHTIVEDTRRAALAKLLDVIPCTCPQCAMQEPKS